MLLEMVKYALIGLGIVGAFCIVVSAFKNGHPLKTVFWSGTAGVLSLVAVSAVGHFTVHMLSINLWTLICSFGLGVPGVILMVLTGNVWGI